MTSLLAKGRIDYALILGFNYQRVGISSSIKASVVEQHNSYHYLRSDHAELADKLTGRLMDMEVTGLLNELREKHEIGLLKVD